MAANLIASLINDAGYQGVDYIDIGQYLTLLGCQDDAAEALAELLAEGSIRQEGCRFYRVQN